MDTVDLAAIVAYSRRRRRSARQEPTASNWVLIPAFAVLIGVMIGGFYVLFSSGGGSSCPLKPVGDQVALSSEAFGERDRVLDEIVALASEGRLGDAQSQFYSSIHSFTHQVDGPISQQDEPLGKRLCDTLLTVEEEFSTASATMVSSDLSMLRGLLAQGGRALGYPP